MFLMFRHGFACCVVQICCCISYIEVYVSDTHQMTSWEVYFMIGQHKYSN